MPLPQNKQLVAEEFDRKGAFNALTDWLNDGTLSKAEAARRFAEVFKIFHTKAQEARKELRHLEAAVARIEAVCRAGMNTRANGNWNGRPQEVERLAVEIGIFDGWVMSLYESDISMIYWGAPDRARAKPTELASSLEALRQKRLANLQLALKDPSLFIIN